MSYLFLCGSYLLLYAQGIFNSVKLWFLVLRGKTTWVIMETQKGQWRSLGNRLDLVTPLDSGHWPNHLYLVNEQGTAQVRISNLVQGPRGLKDEKASLISIKTGTARYYYKLETLFSFVTFLLFSILSFVVISWQTNFFFCVWKVENEGGLKKDFYAYFGHSRKPRR